MDRRSFVIGTAASAAALATGPAFAQEHFPRMPSPSRRVSAGCANDIVTRPIAALPAPHRSSRRRSRPRPRRRSGRRAGPAANAKPDGCTLLSHNNGIRSCRSRQTVRLQPKHDARRLHFVARLTADLIAARRQSGQAAPTRH